MNDNFDIVIGEVDNAIAILREVAQWCEDSRMNMWKLGDLTKERLMNGVKEENFCVGKIDGENACSMILQWQDLLFWPEAKEEEAAYIHKLCVRRKFSRMNLSGKMIQFAIEECKKRKVKYLRLDTGWSNEPLCRLYESFGFKKAGKKTIRAREYALYEMEINF